MEGGLVWGRAAPDTAVNLDGEGIDVAADGLFVVGFHRDAPERQTLRIGVDCTLELEVRQLPS